MRADAMAVASFTPATGLAFVVDFLVEFLEGLLPIRDFFVTAIGRFSKDLKLDLFTPIAVACCVPNGGQLQLLLQVVSDVELSGKSTRVGSHCGNLFEVKNKFSPVNF